MRNLISSSHRKGLSVTEKNTHERPDPDEEQGEVSNETLSSDDDAEIGRPTQQEIEEMAERLLKGQSVYPRNARHST